MPKRRQLRIIGPYLIKIRFTLDSRALLICGDIYVKETKATERSKFNQIASDKPEIRYSPVTGMT